MEGPNKEVKQLIRLRQNRPSFARMISWEFSKVEGNVERKKSKKKSKKQSIKAKDTYPCAEDIRIDDEEEMDVEEEDYSDESSDPSEYDTAPDDEIEQLSDKLSDSVSTTDTFKSLQGDLPEFLINGELGYSDLKGSDNSSDEDNESINAGNKNENLNPNERKRRPSKKQKKKRAEINRLIFANEFSNLMNVFDADDEVEDVFDQMKESQNQVEVNRRVPSLVELSMRATRRKRNLSSSGKGAAVPQVLPYGIKRLLTNLHHDQRVLSKQLSYLQNHILPRISDKDAPIKICVKGKAKFKYPMRSVWASFPYPADPREAPSDLLRSEKSAAFLYTPTGHYLHKSIDFNQLYYENNGFYNYYISSSPSALSAFAVAVDLMLPSTVKEPRNMPKDKCEDTAFTKSLQTMLIRVKLALKARYPNLVDQLFDLVLPYVMWVRGNVTLATEMFHGLIKNETKSRKKAMYISETARMLRQFGDEEGACRFYKMAAEVAITSHKINQKGSEEVSEQTQILLADVHDTGVMDDQKAQKSLSCWSCAMGMPNRKEATVIAGVESILCYHGFHWKDWLETAEKKIDELSEKVPHLLLLRSFTEALRGAESESKRYFREYRLRSFQQVGDNVLAFLDARERNPWKPLIEIVKAQKFLNVKPLNVVWRTHLLPAILSYERPMEAHLNSKELNLHITNTGHLTGDMQMLLPPQRDITLDPYTGSLVINNCPTFIGEWQSAYRDEDYLYSEILLLPTPMLIYSQEDGASVQLLFCGHKAISMTSCFDDTKTTTMLLYWTGPTGQVAKFNLFKFVKDYVYKECDKKIKQNKVHLENYKGNKDIYEYVVKILDEAYKNNLSMDYDLQVSTAEVRYGREKANKKRREQSKGKPYIHNYALNFMLQFQPVVFGKTVMMYICVHGWRRNYYLVFIRTTNKADFQNAQISGTNLAQLMKQTYNADEEFVCLFYGGESCFRLYNEFGTFIENIPLSGYPTQDRDRQGGCDPCIVGPYLYGINKEGSSIWKHMIGVGEDLENDVTLAIVPYWAELGKPGVKNEVKHLYTVGRTVTGKLLLLHLSIGLGFMDPNSMDFVTINLPESSNENVSEDKKIFIGEFRLIDILTEKLYECNGNQVCKTVLAVNNTVIVLDIMREPNTDKPTISVLFRVALPGIAKEACIVGKGIGYLISATMHSNEDHTNYIEHVFYFNNDGQLQGILPFLGKGPRSFHTTYLCGNPEEGEGQRSSKAGWYCYMRDGKGGILGVKLNS